MFTIIKSYKQLNYFKINSLHLRQTVKSSTMKGFFNITTVTFLLVLSTVFTSCHNPEIIPNTPDYSKSESWFESGNIAIDKEKMVDVFYVVPTVIWDWTNKYGDTIHYMDILNPDHRNAFKPSALLGKSAFSEKCNFYSPYYRQITLESWLLPEEKMLERFETAFDDVSNAFEYYMENFNKGKPFILAGHSQGAKAVIELIKNNFNETRYKQFVAAYIIGYSVLKEDVNNCKYLIPAKDSIDTGVYISFISASDTSAINSIYLLNSYSIINPINWHTDSTYANKSQNLGSVFQNKDGSIKEIENMVGAYINTDKMILIVDGVNPEDYIIPEATEYFYPGNYHVFEIPFYFRNLQNNVIKRIESYIEKHDTTKKK